jgi:hypothetical protein
MNNGFYKLLQSAQLIYWKLLLHSNYAQVPINLETTGRNLNYSNRAVINLFRTDGE